MSTYAPLDPDAEYHYTTDTDQHGREFGIVVEFRDKFAIYGHVFATLPDGITVDHTFRYPWSKGVVEERLKLTERSAITKEKAEELLRTRILPRA